MADVSARLAAVAAENASLQLGASTRAPDFRELDACVTAFKTLAVADGQG